MSKYLIFFILGLLFMGADALSQVPAFFFGADSTNHAGLIAKTSGAWVVFRDSGFEATGQQAATGINFERSRHAPPVPIPARSASLNIISGVPGQTIRHFHTYEAIEYRGIYPRIDLQFKADGGGLKSEFHLKPHASVSQIKWRYPRGSHVQIESDGGLSISVEGRIVLHESPPVAWQRRDGQSVTVRSAFRCNPDGSVGFTVSAYDRSQALIIDPVLTFSKSLGGSGTDVATGVTRDLNGNIYITGWTDSLSFSSTQSALPRSNGVDAFVIKLDAATKALDYVTYIGGSGDDRAYGIAVDPSGNAYIAGSTGSSNFPLAGAHQSFLLGNRNAFLAKLDTTGAILRLSTYLGGSGTDSANAIALDSNGNIYVAGETTSTNFPTLTPYQAANVGSLDAFAAKFNAAGLLQFSTYLGGSGDDRGLGLAVDSKGSAYVVGSTQSANFPVSTGVKTKLTGAQNGFVTKLSAAGNTLAYSTYIGGSGGTVVSPEQVNAIAVDYLGDAYVAGITSSADFPVVSAYQTSLGGGWGSDAFVAKIDPTGSHLLYSTYLGGSLFDTATSVEIDHSGNAYVAGYTGSPDFPVVQPIQANPGGLYDAFLAKVGPSGNSLLFSTLFGGVQNDAANSLAGINEVVLAGSTASTDLFPGTAGVNVLTFGVQVSPAAPFGVMDVPTNNSTGLSGAIAVSGWALCEDQVPAVSIWRDTVTGEAKTPSGEVFIGYAAFVAGARPDVAAVFPSYPYNARAGYGLQVLTNELPNSNGNGGLGNGTYRIHAVATNLQNQSVEIGVATITTDNAHSVLPFGAIDTPSPGQTISGTFVNYGWALTPLPSSIPANGSTMVVYIDNQAVGHPVYNNYRPDIATLFPGLANSNGAIGYYTIDTTQLANGSHSLAWSVTDSAGHVSGIGSRLFFVQN